MRVSDWSPDVCSSGLATGRSRRSVIGSDVSQKLERRGARANLSETQAFMDGMKPILVFSDAGGTGRSYHADLACRTADKRRVHFLLEPRSEEHTSELQSLMRSSYAVFCLKKKKENHIQYTHTIKKKPEDNNPNKLH